MSCGVSTACTLPFVILILVSTSQSTNRQNEDCYRIMTEPTGMISWPDRTGEFNNSMDCAWQILGQTDRVIALRFMYMNLYRSGKCWRNYVEIKDGNETGHTIGKLCDTDSPAVKSSINQVTLTYHNEQHFEQEGFRLYYYNTYGEAQGCGGLLSGVSGEIASLDIDNDGQYEPDLDCGWLIDVSAPEQVVKVTFTAFELESPTNGSCSSDYVELREDGSRGPVLGRFCGSILPFIVISSTNRMFVHFHSDDNNNTAGFNLSYTVISSPCGPSSLLATETAQTLTSPNYPNPYPVNLRCKRSIAANKTSLNFDGKHSVEINMVDLDIPCDGDFFQIRSAGDLWYTLKKTRRLCGTRQPRIFTYREGAEIVFYSNSLNNGAHGFSLTFEIDSCRRNYANDGGEIFNSAYFSPVSGVNPEFRCLLNITASEGKTVSLYFVSFGFSPPYNCSTHYLKVYDGPSDSYPLLGTFCDHGLYPPLFTTGRSMFIDVLMESGYGIYQFTYTATDKGRGCGGSVYGIDGVITSPLYPQPYNQPGECTWHIAVPGYHTLILGFSRFHLPYSSDCSNSYVEVYKGSTDDISARIGRYCGQRSRYLDDFPSNEAIIKFVTDTSNDQCSFKLSFYTSAFKPDTSVNLIQRYQSTDSG